MAAQITSVFIVYPIVSSGTDQRKQHSSASLAFERGIHRGPVNSPHRRPVTRKMSPFDDVIMRQQVRILVQMMAWQWTGVKPLAEPWWPLHQQPNDLINWFTSQSEIIKVPRHHRVIVSTWYFIIVHGLLVIFHVGFIVLGQQHVMVIWDSPRLWQDGLLTHWGRNKMDAISQTTFWNVFSWMKIFEFQIKFHWNMFLGV